MSQPTELTVSPRRTRASNATAHPGEIVRQAMRNRRTKEEMVAAKDAKAAKAAATQAGLQRVADIELDMEAKQAKMLSKKAKAVRPAPTSRGCGKEKKDAPQAMALPEGIPADVAAACGITENVSLVSIRDLEHSPERALWRHSSMDQHSMTIVPVVPQLSIKTHASRMEW